MLRSGCCNMCMPSHFSPPVNRVQDDVAQYFEDVLPYGAFSVRVPQCDIQRLHAILSTIPRRELALLQVIASKKSESFAWNFAAKFQACTPS